MFGLDTTYTILLILCLFAACAFEFINGFHDTANAVATVIYTHSLKPTTAVVWSGLWNFIGVNVGGIAVAMGIVNLLPVELLVDKNLLHGLSMILPLIITAIIWNLATWYIGMPCSSSHTLIGSIFGVGLAYYLIPGSHSSALNWGKVIDVGLSLFISPVLGFAIAIILMFILRKLVHNNQIFNEPTSKKPPPMWIRSILVLTCTSVSYAHGSNDGQKGVGLIMLILIAFSPVFFSVDRSKHPENLLYETKQIEWNLRKIDQKVLSITEQSALDTVFSNLTFIKQKLAGIRSFDDLEHEDHFNIRKCIILVSKKTEMLLKKIQTYPGSNISGIQISIIRSNLRDFKTNTEYAPRWVILLVSISLGLGTMIGWKRIVVTIGEKIGKTHMSYAQGASANLVATITILASSWLGLPVSTTHVLSSGVAGTMVAGSGRQNLRMGTVKSIALAWLITLPVTILLSGILFFVLRTIFV
ncbi:MAG: inorganic phosphate transporter [Alphaproteobacteria bacterium]|nr:inorganic phosphate transporter [Alphaproteobacteria bacterium]